MKPAYAAVVRDVTEKMGNGMADYARRSASGKSVSSPLQSMTSIAGM